MKEEIFIQEKYTIILNYIQVGRDEKTVNICQMNENTIVNVYAGKKII